MLLNHYYNDYVNKFSIPVNNDIFNGSLEDRSSQMLMTLTFMFLYKAGFLPQGRQEGANLEAAWPP